MEQVGICLTSEDDMTKSNFENDSPYILIVDNDFALRQILVEIIQFAGYQAVPVAGAPEALEFLKLTTTRPQLIVADILMIEIDGYQFLQAVRKSESGDPTLFLFISAQEATDILETPTADGVVGYLSKPFEVDALLQVVAHVMGHATEQ